MIAAIAFLAQVASSLPTDASALERSISALESCISALDSSAETFSKSSVSLEPWSWLFTILVAVGVAMEFWVIRDTYREDLETWAVTFFGVNRTVRPPTKRLVVEHISVALVAGGIIGELVIGVMIASINVQLRGIDTQLRTKNGELRTKSDQLVALINNRAAQAERDLAVLQKSVQWRHLSDSQKKGLCAGLSPTFPSGVFAPLNDIEADNFAREIVIAIAVCRTGKAPARAAPSLPNESPLDVPIFGLWIRVGRVPPETFSARLRNATKLRRTLERIGVPVEGISNEMFEGIYVGHMPIAATQHTKIQPSNALFF